MASDQDFEMEGDDTAFAAGGNSCSTCIEKNCCVSTAVDKQLESIIFLITRVRFREYEGTSLTVLLGPSHLKGISSDVKTTISQSAHSQGATERIWKLWRTSLIIDIVPSAQDCDANVGEF
jgi:hypothetical protein